MIEIPTDELGNVDVAELATRLRSPDADDETAHYALADLFAPTVTMIHTPPAPIDGFQTDAFIRDGFRDIVVWLRHILTGYRYRLDAVEAVGNAVHVTFTWLGTLPDGRALDYTHEIYYVVQGGQVVLFLTCIVSDPAQRALVLEACVLGREDLATKSATAT